MYIAHDFLDENSVHVMTCTSQLIHSMGVVNVLVHYFSIPPNSLRCHARYHPLDCQQLPEPRPSASESSSARSAQSQKNIITFCCASDSRSPVADEFFESVPLLIITTLMAYGIHVSELSRNQSSFYSSSGAPVILDDKSSSGRFADQSSLC
jgi:hypothetical protein